MHHTDQSLKKQKIHAEDVAYAAYHDTVYDVGEELLKYEKCAVLSDVKLQTVFDELDVLKNSVDTAYEVLLDAALSPLSSRLKRSNANLKTRIADLMNLLTNTNIEHTAVEQAGLCDTSEPDCQDDRKSRVIVDTTDCYEDGTVQIEYPNVQSYNAPTLLLTVSILMTVVIDSEQSCQGNPDSIDSLTVAPDQDRHMEKDTVPGYETNGVLYRNLNMTMMKIADYCDAETDDHVSERRSISGLKHRWRWKHYELLYRTDPGTDIRTMIMKICILAIDSIDDC